jgi:hypothetical protein
MHANHHDAHLQSEHNESAAAAAIINAQEHRPKHIEVKRVIQTHAATLISNLSFNTKYTHLAISSNKVKQKKRTNKQLIQFNIFFILYFASKKGNTSTKCS